MALGDAMIVGACLDNGIPRLLSEDLPGGRIEGLEITNPFD
jgi:predicted nucleic acid-binding protein